jgi:thiol-disulfide isomerase/thioredoxin
MAKAKRPQRPGSSARPGNAAKRSSAAGSTQQPARVVGGGATAGQPASNGKAQWSGGAPEVSNGSASRFAGKPPSGGRPSSTGSGASRAASARAAPAPAKRRYEQQSWWQRAIGGPRSTWVALVAIVLVVALFALIARNRQAEQAPTTVTQSVAEQVTHIPASVYEQVGDGGLQVALKATQGRPAILKDSSGKPQVLYVGAEYCPYCAAERWSLVAALSRFGTFSGLEVIKSGEGNIPTFSFVKSSYSSPNVSFASVETEDSNGNRLQQLSAEQQQITAKYNAPPYTGSSGAIPFTDIANQYVRTGSGFQPDVIQSGTWQGIADALSVPNSPEAKAIVGNANILTAAICQTTNNQPANVCTAAPIPALQQQLPKGT